jgi:lysine 2,3-aminomutase
MSNPDYTYVRQALVEPDWCRFPGWRDVTAAQWADVQWQRSHCVKGVRQLKALCGDLLEDTFYADVQRDQECYATMPILIPPHMLNTMVPQPSSLTPAAFTAEFYADPIRCYMLPVASDRRTDWPSHPLACRDSLHEREMWVTEGLTHRYPTKVMAELVSTCPQYCGHCTRMDLVGTSTPQVEKVRFDLKPVDRTAAMLAYLRNNPGVRDVVVSGGDVANVPWPQLEAFLQALLDLESVRDIRLATKGLVGLPQHWLQKQVLAGLERIGREAARRAVNLAIHTHANHAHSVTPLVAEAARAVLDAGVRDVRNQGVLLRGVNATHNDLLDLCFALQGEANILPYYFYMCDIVPHSEHWRVSVAAARELQQQIMGHLPGYATPRIVCDVPYLGKRWVHQLQDYDHTLGISYWGTSSTRTTDTGLAVPEPARYYDPVHTLSQEGRQWWRSFSQSGATEPLRYPGSVGPGAVHPTSLQPVPLAAGVG